MRRVLARIIEDSSDYLDWVLDMLPGRCNDGRWRWGRGRYGCRWQLASKGFNLAARLRGTP